MQLERRRREVNEAQPIPMSNAEVGSGTMAMDAWKAVAGDCPALAMLCHSRPASSRDILIVGGKGEGVAGNFHSQVSAETTLK